MKAQKITKAGKPKLARSDVAKPGSKTSLLSKKVKFNWKIVAVVIGFLVAALEYLYVSLGKVGAVAYQTWYVEFFQSFGLAIPNVIFQPKNTVLGSFPSKV